MSAFTVEEVVGEPRTWQSKYGDMLSYTLRLQGHPDPVELSQKPETPAPSVGQSIEGEIVPSKGDFPAKLKRERPQGGGAGNWSGGGMSPEREKRIVRQHSQSMSIETLKLAVDCGIDLQVNDVASLVQKIKVLSDVFDGDAGV